MRFFWLFLCGLLLAACGDESPEPAPSEVPAGAGTVRADIPDQLELAIPDPWSVSALDYRADAGGLLASISHSGDYLQVWSIDRDRVASPLARVDVGYHPDSVRWLDWNGDGARQELLVSVEGTSTVQVWRHADRDLEKLGEVATPDPTRTAEAADLDGDGLLDLILGPYDAERITILWNQGDFEFEATFMPASRIPMYPVLTDWNRNGLTDIAWSTWVAGDVQVALNQGERQFTLHELQAEGPGTPRHAVAGDIDGDGYPDLVVAMETGEEARILYNDRQGGVDRVETLPAPDIGYSYAMIDDDTDDTVTILLGSIQVVVLARRSEGDWQLRRLGVPGVAVDLRLADLDGDGARDLVYANRGGEDIGVIFGPLWERAEAFVPESPAS